MSADVAALVAIARDGLPCSHGCGSAHIDRAHEALDALEAAQVPVVAPVSWVDDGEGGHFRAGPIRGDTYRADDGCFRWVVMGLSQDEDDVEADGCIRGEGDTMEAVREACAACARRKVREMAEALGMPLPALPKGGHDGE